MNTNLIYDEKNNTKSIKRGTNANNSIKNNNFDLWWSIRSLLY